MIVGSWSDTGRWAIYYQGTQQDGRNGFIRIKKEKPLFIKIRLLFTYLPSVKILIFLVLQRHTVKLCLFPSATIITERFRREP